MESNQQENPRWEKDETRWSEWMRAAQQGDDQAYRQLLNELSKALGVYLKFKFGDFLFLDDCVQECLLSIHKARHTYNPAKKFRPWMFTIARNKTIDILRSNAKYQNNDSLDHNSAEHRMGLGELREDRVLSARRDAGTLLNKLSQDHQEIILLTQYEGYTTLEVSKKLGISESAAKARLGRGLSAVNKLWLNEL